LSRSLRLSALARLAGDSAFLGAGMWDLSSRDVSISYVETPNSYGAIRTEGPQGYPGGPNGPAAVLQGTRGGATWKNAVSQNPAVVDQIFDRTPYVAMRQPRNVRALTGSRAVLTSLCCLGASGFCWASPGTPASSVDQWWKVLPRTSRAARRARPDASNARARQRPAPEGNWRVPCVCLCVKHPRGFPQVFCTSPVIHPMRVHKYP
jgi:hypothetical protein